MNRLKSVWNVACVLWAKWRSRQVVVMGDDKSGVNDESGQPGKNQLSENKKKKNERSGCLMAELKEYLLSHYEFRYNVLTEVTEMRPVQGQDRRFRVANQRELNSLCIDIRMQGIDCWDKDLSRYINSTKVEEYHPFQLYLDELPEWDGVDRVTELALRVSDNELWVRSFCRWMLALTAQWKGMTGVHANSVAPMLISSEQGMLKSTFCKSIVPDSLKDYYMDSFDLSSQGQAELKMALMGLINLDEFDKFSSHKMPLLKNIMQTSSLNLRKAHQKNFRSLPRIASFIGTSNKKDLLADPTGSRRFVCVEPLHKINCDGIVHDQLYAQLKAALEKGERYWFVEAEEKEIQQHNASYYRQSLEEELFFSSFRAARVGEPCSLLSLSEIFKLLKQKNPSVMRGINPVHFGQALVSSGVLRKHTRDGNRYCVICL